MKTIGNVVLIGWVLLSLFAFVGSVLKNSFVTKLFQAHRRRINIVGIVLMMTWIMLIGLGGLFNR